MQILFFISIISFLTMVWAGLALTRHLHRISANTPASGSSRNSTRSSAALNSPRI